MSSTTYQLFSIILLLIFLPPSIQIQLIYGKKNVFIALNSWYQSQVELKRQNAQLIPTQITISNAITNSLPTIGTFFDYFYYLSTFDMNCYISAINNQSYLLPCPFLQSKYSLLRTDAVLRPQQVNQLPIQQINDIRFQLIVDNTQFPFPEGAFPYSTINVDTNTQLQIKVSSSYRWLGKRLIFINVTVLLIYGIIIIVLVCKHARISKKMQLASVDSGIKQQLRQQNNSEDNSADQNYDQIDKDPSSMLSSQSKQPPQKLLQQKLLNRLLTILI